VSGLVSRKRNCLIENSKTWEIKSRILRFFSVEYISTLSFCKKAIDLKYLLSNIQIAEERRMHSYVHAQNSPNFFGELSEELTQAENGQEEVLLGYKRNLGFVLEHIPKETFHSKKSSDQCLRKFSQAAYLLLHEVDRKEWQKLESDASKLEYLEKALQTCQHMEKLANNLNKKFRKVFKQPSEKTEASFQNFLELQRIESEFHEAKRKVVEVALEFLGIDEDDIDDTMLESFENASSFFETACEMDYDNIAVACVQKGVDSETFAEQSSSPLIFALKNKRSQVALELISKQEFLETEDEDGNSPLILAISNGLSDVATALIEQGVDIECTDDEGKKALELALEKNLSQVAAKLIEKGAEISDSDEELLFPELLRNGLVESAYDMLRKDPEFDVQLAVEDNCLDATSVQSVRGDTVLGLACREKNSEIVANLIENGANLDAVNKYGDTALHISAANGYLAGIEKFLAEDDPVNASIDVQNFTGFTPLISALKNGEVKAALLLIQKGADISKKDRFGNSSLHYALQNGHIEVVASLLEKLNPEDMLNRNMFGETPWKLYLQFLQTNPDVNKTISLLKILLEDALDASVIREVAKAQAANPKQGFQTYIAKHAKKITQDGKDEKALQALLKMAFFFEDTASLQEICSLLHKKASLPLLVQLQATYDFDPFLKRVELSQFPWPTDIQYAKNELVDLAKELINFSNFSGASHSALRSEVAKYKKEMTACVSQHLASNAKSEGPKDLERDVCVQEMMRKFITNVVSLAFKVQRDQVLLGSIVDTFPSLDEEPSVKKMGFINWEEEIQDLSEKHGADDVDVKAVKTCYEQIELLQKEELQKIQDTIFSMDCDHAFIMLQKLALSIKNRGVNTQDFVERASGWDAQKKGLLPEFQGYREEDLYLGEGVCYGATLELLSKKLKDPETSATIQPSKQARFLQVAHSLYVNAESRLFNKSMQILRGELTRKKDYKEQCLLLFQMLKQKAGFLQDQALQEQIALKKKEFDVTLPKQGDRSYYQELAKELKGQFAELQDSQGSDLKIDTFFLEKYGINLEVIDLDDVKPEAFVRNLETYINRVESSDGRKIVLLLGQTKDKDAAHAVYCSLSSPFEFQDPGFPGFTGFKTDDINEFKLYLTYWFLHEKYDIVMNIEHAKSEE
jgi:ankyrin repeat protein